MKVLEKHWPHVPRWRDIRDLTGESFYGRTGLRTVDIISGGFPCQPFSVAGKRRGKEDDRYLWPDMLRVISEIRPAWVVGENVAGIVSMALDTVLSDMESIGYACQAFIIPACAVDAPHRRDRCAIVAYSDGGRCLHGQTEKQSAKGRGATQSDAWTGSTALANPDREGQQMREKHEAPDAGGEDEKPHRPALKCGEVIPDANGKGLQESGSEPTVQAVFTENRIKFRGWWPAEPDVGRVVDGLPNRVDRLRCLGNAVVPAQFYPVFKAIADIEAMNRGDADDV